MNVLAGLLCDLKQLAKLARKKFSEKRSKTLATLSSKIIEITDKDALASLYDEIDAWLPAYAYLEGKQIKISVETGEGNRFKKLTAAKILGQLVLENTKGENTTWSYKDYKFMFLIKSYWWNGNQIYLTAAEALAIYRVIVLNDRSAYKELSYLLRNARKRIGKDFLADIIPRRVKNDHS